MVEPLTLAAVGAVALTEGVKFLYSQAGELLRLWRERRRTAAPESQIQQTPPALPSAIEGDLKGAFPDLNIVEELATELAELRRSLAGVAEEGEDVDLGDEDLLASTDALRRALETVYGRPLVFAGERRPEAGTSVDSRVQVEIVKGMVAGLHARRVSGGAVRSDVRAKTVEEGGRLTGVEIDTIE